MAKKKKIAYWLLPVAALCLTSTIMSVGESQARYVNHDIWHTVAEPSRPVVTSNYLQQTSRPPLTILLSQMALESREVSFVLDSTDGVSGALTWSVDKPEYMDVQVRIGETVLTSGDTVSLDEGAPVTVVMMLMPTEKAAEPREQVEVNVQVGWSDALAGTFRAVLSPVTADQPQTDKPEEPQPEETEDIQAQTESGQLELPQKDMVAPTDTQPQPVITLQGFQTYHPELMFPLEISADMPAQVELSLLQNENPQDFPQGTRFSLDRGKTWFMLYHEGKIPVDVPAGEKQIVMLDLSSTTLATETGLTISASDIARVTLTANTEPVFWMSSQVLTRNTEIIITTAELWQDCELTCSVDMLVSTENGKVYEPAEISPQGLMAEITSGTNKQQISIRIMDKLPQPGTYRVNLSWHYNGTCIWQTQTSFFINYSENTITNQTGGDR